MTLAALAHWLQYAVAAGFALLGLASLRDWARYRDRGHGWLAIALGLLGVTSLVGLLPRRRPAVQRARLRALSAGYAGIVGVLVFALAASALATNPSSSGIVIVTDLLALAVVPLLYAGFAPPRWLRALWRQQEEENTRRA